MKDNIESFEEFWVEYVLQHQKKLTRQIHFAGTTAALACAAGGILLRKRWLLVAAPVAGYGPAWLSHFLVEGNRPATFRYPLWSLKADLVMWRKILDGTMDAEVERIIAAHGRRNPTADDSGIATNMATDGTLH